MESSSAQNESAIGWTASALGTNTVSIAFAAIVLYVAVGFDAALYDAQQFVLSQSRWTHSQCTVQSSEWSPHPEPFKGKDRKWSVRYTYSFDSKPFVGETSVLNLRFPTINALLQHTPEPKERFFQHSGRTLFHRNEEERLAPLYSPGAVVDCLVNPDEPEMSVLFLDEALQRSAERSSRFSILQLLGIFVACVLLGVGVRMESRRYFQRVARERLYERQRMQKEIL